jgi:hypothetical protein
MPSLLTTTGLTGLAALLACAAAPARAVPSHRPPQPPLLSTLPPTQTLPHAAQGLARPYGGTPIDVTTYHYDNFRTGWNQSETDLTQATVASANFGLLTTLQVDGNVFAQPLMLSNFVMPDGSTHNVLIIATGHNTVYAYDAQSYAVLWQVSLGQSQSTSDVGCGDVKPEYGITSTPVIVRKSANQATVYVVAATEPSSFTFVSQLHALDIGTGKDLLPPVVIAPSAKLSDGSTVRFDPRNQWNRASLAYNNGALYIGIGSHCDNNSGAISGWLLDYDTTLTLRSAFHTIEAPASTELASIWMAGFAPAIAPNGNVFVVTGNGNFTGKKSKDWGESALSLPPTLSRVKSQFTPADYQQLNNSDQDFGSGGIMLLPPVAGQTAPPLAVAMGKTPTIFLLDQNKMGGEKANNSGVLQAVKLAASNGVWGGPAYYAGSGGPTVYYQANQDVLRAFSVATGAKPALIQSQVGTSTGGYGGSLPIVSSNGTAAGSGVVWLIRRSLPLTLEAYDADSLGAPIFAANAGTWSNKSQSNSFVTPLEANGRVYVPAYKTVTVFGLQQ